MRPEQWDRVQELFERARQLPEAERRSFLEVECADDREVLAEVESLLGYSADDLVHPSQLAQVVVESASPDPPQILAGYHLIRKLGEGGMGVVYQAEQEHPVRRPVAVKLIRAGMDTEQIVNRFRAEQQALALMSHPHIARVYDAGAADDGRPYFVMEYAPGPPITHYCDDARLTIRQRLELFIRICEGIQHAHQKGIIHRDVKPSNVLVTDQDGRPVPKIIDFGIAKAVRSHTLEATMMTEVGQVVGTLAYMSPEQAHLTGHDIDTRTDVYSLGVLLYELLVGALPFDTTSERVPFDEVCRRIREEDPPRPSTRLRNLGEAAEEVSRRRRREPAALLRDLRGDLDWIVMKALEKDRMRRYASASELAADIHRFVDHQPVAARPPGTAYRVGKFVRRHRVGVASAALLIVALVGGIVATSVAMVRAKRAEREAVAVADYLVEVFRAPREGRVAGAALTALELLDTKAEQIRGDLEEEPGIRGRMMVAMAEAYRGLGEHRKASALLEDALPLLRQVYGPEGEEVFNALNELGNLANQLQDYTAAKRYFEAALPIAERRMGQDHENVATILKNLADSSIELEDLDAARTYLERTLAIRSRVFGADDPRLAPALSSLGRVLSETGDHAAAVETARMSLEIRQAAYEPGDRRVGFGFYALAGALYEADRHAEAAERFEAAADVFRESLGPEHAHVGSCLLDLAKARMKLGEADAAYTLYRRARAIHEAAFRTDDPETAGALAKLLAQYADFLDELGRPEEAEATRAEAAGLGFRHGSGS